MLIADLLLIILFCMCSHVWSPLLVLLKACSIVNNRISSSPACGALIQVTALITLVVIMERVLLVMEHSVVSVWTASVRAHLWECVKVRRHILTMLDNETQKGVFTPL